MESVQRISLVEVGQRAHRQRSWLTTAACGCIISRLPTDALRAHGRDRAAGLLEEAERTESTSRKPSSDLEAQAAAQARATLVKQVLGVFSTDELTAELERRDQAEHDLLNQEGQGDAMINLKADWGVP